MMRKIVLLLMVLVGVLTARAEGYTYLTFETTDGAKASVAVESLTLSISGNTLTAGEKSFTLSNLAKMYFSETDESTATGIEAVSSAALDEVNEIYDLNGRKVVRPSSNGQLPRGVYIVKTKEKTFKLVVR
jgi:flagellar basal body-associated protein FliL